ncbi:MAG: MaoC family dehydratase [Zoogloeaceae bacterium]|jgi:acyl dehydratase|nr:MaoC family dehydratase [Zoogloeaceae bacterium]
MNTLHLEDLSIGDTFASRPLTLSADDIKGFARQFDPQPFHLDEATAQDSFFQGLAASGWHTAALSMRLLVETLPLAGGVIGAGVELDWPQPVRPGDTLSIRISIEDIRPSRSRPDRGIVHLLVSTLNQSGALCQTMRAKVLAFRRPESA